MRASSSSASSAAAAPSRPASRPALVSPLPSPWTSVKPPARIHRTTIAAPWSATRAASASAAPRGRDAVRTCTGSHAARRSGGGRGAAQREGVVVLVVLVDDVGGVRGRGQQRAGHAGAAGDDDGLLRARIERADGGGQ